MHRSHAPYFFLILAAVLSLSALSLLLIRSGMERRLISKPAPAPPAMSTTAPPMAIIDPTDEPEPPEKNFASTNGRTDSDPANVIIHITKALEGGDFDAFARLVGKDVCDAKTLEHLKSLAASHPFKIQQPNGVREIGELEMNSLSRWSLKLDGALPGRDLILLNLRLKDGKWTLDNLTLPPLVTPTVPPAVLTDSLGIADAFLQAVIKQNFILARGYVNPKSVSDAKIAALCILFEEGQYEMRHAKPLRAMFQRGDTVGYLANVQPTDGNQTAQFALTLRHSKESSNWIIVEINLDQLLADYTRRVAGGDIYYSPLIKNPQGGETLGLYFDFNDDQINPRTRRQLEIVVHILRTNPGKNVTLSGHTDALGTPQYNNQLSARRAAIVRDFLADAGVSPAQIVTNAKGASQPRRPNITESGDDNPDGRRANRRTEIYIDL